MSAGVTFLTSWTWSKSTDGSFGASNFYVSSITTSPQDTYNLGAEYGLAIVNTPSSLKNAVSYELPFGKGKPFLSGNRALEHVLGGWQVNVVSLLQTGFPLAITQDQNFNSVIAPALPPPNSPSLSPPPSTHL